MNERVCLYVSPYKEITSYYEMIDLAAKNGIGFLEPVNQYELSNPDAHMAYKIKKYADSKGVKVNCFSLCINLVGEGKSTAVKRAKEYVDIAGIFGAEYFHHTIASEYRNPEIIESNKENYYNDGICAVREIYDYAAKKSIKTVFEDQGYLFNGIENFKRFINEVDRNVGVVADLGNIKFVNEDIDAFFDTFADKIVNVHIKDFAKSDDGYKTKNGEYITDCMLGCGTVNFDSAFNKVKQIGYSGTFSLECPPVNDGDQKSAFTHNLLVLNKYIKAL